MEFLEIVQNSEFKKGASLLQLTFRDGEEVEELMDDYGYEEILTRQHDQELQDILGDSLFAEYELAINQEHARENIIAFVNGLGFHLLDFIVILETEYNIPGETFTNEVIKKMEKRLPHFPYMDKEKTVFALTREEMKELLQSVTDGVVRI